MLRATINYGTSTDWIMADENESEGWEETQYESLDWGGDEDSTSNSVSLYPTTSKPSQAAIALLLALNLLLYDFL